MRDEKEEMIQGGSVDDVIQFLNSQPVNKDLLAAMDEMVDLYEEWVRAGKPRGCVK